MGATKVIQVTNVAPGATLEQMKTLFGFLGDIEEIQLFPQEDSIIPVTSRVCFVKYEDSTSVGVAQHLTNTVFIDRALIVVPCGDGTIPDESKALMIAAPANAVAGLMPAPGGGLLPTPSQSILGQLPLAGLAGAAQITAPFDPTLAALGLPQPPPLPGNVDPSKIEEIRRTIYVGNLDSQTVTAEQLLNFFSQVGEVKYVRMAGDETQPTRFAFVEFSDQNSVAAALTYNGVMFGGRPLKINHSNNAIVKPQTKTPEAAAREMEEAMKRVRDAQALIQAAIDPVFETDIVPLIKSRTRSKSKERRKRSRSRSRRRSRSRSRRRSRSRSRKRSRSKIRRSRSRTPPPKRRSRSPRRRRSRSPSRRRSRSRSRDYKKSRTPPRSYRSRYSRSRSSPVNGTGNDIKRPVVGTGTNNKRDRRRRSRSRSKPRRSRSRTRRSRTPKRKASRSPKRKTSRSPKRRSKTPKRRPSRSPKRRTSRSPKCRTSKSPKKRASRSSSGSPRRMKRKKKDKERDRSRERERERDRERERSRKHKKDKERERERKKSKSTDKDVKVTVVRDYDEEEKGYDSDKEKEQENGSKDEQEPEDIPTSDYAEIKEEKESPQENTEQMDMDLSD
uniref:Splicing regulatory glutamine/lysine-rich protein 1-like isoform X2 n=1 Tax=Saccoglossus kowalevskii TaxID=10224 RepID=A0ABM0MWC8_SACKO|nr:PREDICTED: splicing regulatory glutamine/lysine-rich protein 1-like isoform X2 [Saccoglossus kowalevskii]